MGRVWCRSATAGVLTSANLGNNQEAVASFVIPANALNSLLGQFASRQPTEAAEQAPPVRSSGHPKAAKQETTWA
jgi:hypothetical protein